MSFDTVQEWRARGRALAEGEIASSVVERDRAARWDERCFRLFGGAGLLGAALPASGGEASSAARLPELLRGFAEGSGDAGLAVAWGAHAVAALRIAREGTSAQRRRFSSLLAGGEAVGAWARREPGRGSDPQRLAPRAYAHGDGWVIEGASSWVVNAAVASVIVVDAVINPTSGGDVVSTFLVPTGAPGVHVGAPRATSGLRTAVIGDIAFDGVAVTFEDRLGEDGAASSTAARLAARSARAGGWAALLGIARVLFDQTVSLFRQPGSALARSQASRAALADLRIQIELAERLHDRAVARLEEGLTDDRDLAVASVFLGRSLPAILRDAARLQGDAGVELGHLAERAQRDVATFARLAEPEHALAAALGASLLALPVHEV